MALELKISAEVNADGTILNLTDITGNQISTAYNQGGNINYSSVTNVRIKTATYASLQNPATLSSGSFTQYVEYICSAGPCTINGKTFNAGDVFVPQSANISVSGTWVETGYYVYPFLATWLPTASEVPLDITISELNETGDTVADTVRVVDYEIYYNNQTPTIAAVNGATYLVSGTGAVAYGGNVYYVGEVFTASDTTNITVSAGSPRVNTLYATTTLYFTTTYNIETSMYSITLSTFGKPNYTSTAIPNSIIYYSTLISALNNACYTNNVDITQAYDVILYISTSILNLQGELS